MSTLRADQPIARYSSLAACLAHYRALKSAAALTQPERAVVEELERVIEQMPAAERQAIGAGTPPRHYQRAQRHLLQLLSARGIVAE